MRYKCSSTGARVGDGRHARRAAAARRPRTRPARSRALALCPTTPPPLRAGTSVTYYTVSSLA